MKPTVLFVIASDPRATHRPAEAVRIAAGVGAWKKAEITVYLRGPAILALGEWVDELQQDDNFTRYLPILRESGRPILIERGSPFLSELGEATLPFVEIDDRELATRVAESRCVLRF